MIVGNVYLVGAGPGDPGLLTLRGLQCLRSADVVVYDALLNPVLLEHAPRAEHIYVGKKADRHSLPQEEIQRILRDHARQGKQVVRLKGGDPFVFGRGGEEALALAEADVPVEVVPGVTAGIAAAAYAGIPVTHRGLATSVTFVTGHLSGEDKVLDIDFGRFDPKGTLVCYMGVGALSQIQTGLRANGWQGDTPCAVVEWGTYARQCTVTEVLDRIPEAVAAVGIQAPAIIIVGAVVKLRQTLAWFESRPLYGLRMALTHARQGTDALEQRLRALGADVYACPTVEISPDSRPQPLGELQEYSWVVLTSPNAARMVFSALDEAGHDARYLGGVKLCAVGSSTLAALEERFIRPDVLPENYTSDAIVAAMNAEGGVEGMQILIPRADIARASLSKALAAEGANVTEVAAYHTQAPTGVGDALAGLLDYAPELLVFTSGAAVHNLCGLLSTEQHAALSSMAQVASIGPVTSRVARDAGFTVATEPARHDVAHLVEVICGWYDTHGGSK